MLSQSKGQVLSAAGMRVSELSNESVALTVSLVDHLDLTDQVIIPPYYT